MGYRRGLIGGHLISRAAAMGDPGLGSFLKKAVGFVGKAAMFVPGPIGIAGRVGKLAGIAGRVGKLAKIGSGLGKMALGGAAFGAGGAAVSRFLPGSAGEPSLPGAGPSVLPIGGGGTAAERRAMGFPSRSGRRMNVANVKALRRSIRRVQGFKNLATQCFTLTKAVRMKKRGKRCR